MKKHSILVKALFVYAMLFSACSEKFEYPKLTVTPVSGEIVFTPEATESYTFEVRTNQGSWSAKPDQDWCVVTPDYSNNTFTVTALPNENHFPRNFAVITVEAGEAAAVNIKAAMPVVAVYVIGSWNDDTNTRLCYWINGVRFDLEENINTIDEATLSDGSVYILGYYNGNYCYWKDGVRTDLDGISDLYVTKSGIAVSEGSVHIAVGYNDVDNGNGIYYWNDGSRQELPVPEGSDAYFNSIISSDGSVYVMGEYEKKDIGRVLCYWKDGTRTDLEGLDHEKITYNAIAVEDGSVYLLGYEQYYSLPHYRNRPYWWKDGVVTYCQVPETYLRPYPRAIAVNKGTVHIIGQSGSDLVYWKDGVMTTVEYGSGDSRVEMRIAACEGSAYMVGHISGEPTYIGRPCYWKDGVRVDLDVPDGSGYSAGYMIFAEKR